MTNIDRNSPVPLYYQLKQIIADNLDKGIWKPGDLVPSEQELQNTYGVSRITVRQAFSELTHEGRFERHRGQGTFVANKPIVHNPSKRISISELMHQQGIAPEWHIRQRDFVTPLPNIQEQLGIRSNSKVYFVDFLLYADNIVVDNCKSFGERACMAGGLGHIRHVDIMPLVMAHADKLTKYGA